MKTNVVRLASIVAMAAMFGFSPIAHAQTTVTSGTTVTPYAVGHSRSVSHGRMTHTVRVIHGRHGVTCRVVRNTVHGRFGRGRSVSRRTCR